MDYNYYIKTTLPNNLTSLSLYLIRIIPDEIYNFPSSLKYLYLFFQPSSNYEYYLNQLNSLIKIIPKNVVYIEICNANNLLKNGTVNIEISGFKRTEFSQLHHKNSSCSILWKIEKLIIKYLNIIKIIKSKWIFHV